MRESQSKTKNRTESEMETVFSLDCISETQWSDTYRCSISVWWVMAAFVPLIQHLLSIYAINKTNTYVYKVLWFLPSKNSQWILRDYDDLLHIAFELIYPHCRSGIYPLYLLLQIHATSFSSVYLQSIHFLDNQDPSQFD